MEKPRKEKKNSFIKIFLISIPVFLVVYPIVEWIASLLLHEEFHYTFRWHVVGPLISALLYNLIMYWFQNRSSKHGNPNIE